MGGWSCAGALLKQEAVWNGDRWGSSMGLGGGTAPRHGALTAHTLSLHNTSGRGSKVLNLAINTHILRAMLDLVRLGESFSSDRRISSS